jgi:hypothetical protein
MMMRSRLSASDCALLCTATLIGLVIAGSAPLAAFAAGDPLSVGYSFDRPQITEVTIDGQQYHRVTMPGCSNGGNAGEPALPACGARILLPYGSEVGSIEIVPGERVVLGDGYVVEPVARPERFSAGPDAAKPPKPDPVIYASTEAFPRSEFEEIGTYGFRGYRILTLKLNPVQYVPASGELYYYPQLTVVVNVVDSAGVNALYRGLEEDAREVLGKIDNPELVSTYVAAGPRGERSSELLILTTPALADAFQPLKDLHDANGLLTEICTTTDVGSSSPDDVRDYIRERYENDGISYVIIGADDDIIPAKDLYVSTGGGGYTEYNMPADIYFACLDGTYNHDGDAYWGEPTDGEGGGDVDLVAEVYVGRACAGNTTEATRFVNKTMWYINNQHTQPEKVLLVGEYLGFGGVADWGGNYMDELVNGSSAHGYVTVGIPSDVYDIDRLYERDGYWSQSQLVQRINSGVHILNHLGHGDVGYAMKLYSSDITNLLHNDDYCLVYSQTCLAGHFDNADCWAEYMNIKTDNGGFAVIMNARYGFGEYNSTDGPSQRFNRELWDAVYGEGIPELGRANQDSKEDNLYRINQECMRWCTYEINLFGDPTLRVKGVTGLRAAPGGNLNAAGPDGGPFEPDSITYTLSNLGPDPIEYEVTKSVDWISITNASGTIPGESFVEVTVSINENANTLGHGLHEDTVYFTNTTDHEGDTLRLVSVDVDAMHLRYAYPMDADPGWTTEGQWAFGQPIGEGSHNGDPLAGHTGNAVYGYNLAGDYANDMPAYHLTTTAIDCSNLVEVELRFWRWLGVERSPFDSAAIAVSSDGLNWTELWSNPESLVADTVWRPVAVDISEVADNQPTVYVRWTMGATDETNTYPGWNIDDVEIWAVSTAPACPGDLDGDGDVDLADLSQLLANYGVTGGATYEDGDLDGDGDVDLGDLSALLAVYGTTC